MNPTILNKLTWKDIQEVVREADLMLSTHYDVKKKYPTQESYYGEVLDRLKERNNRHENNQKEAK